MLNTWTLHTYAIDQHLTLESWAALGGTFNSLFEINHYPGAHGRLLH